MANARTFAQVLWFDAGNQQYRTQQSRQLLSRIPESRVLHMELSDLQSDLGRAAPRVFFWFITYLRARSAKLQQKQQ